MWHSLTPSDPTPTAQQIRDRLQRTREVIDQALALWEAHAGEDRIAIAHLLNAHGTPLLTGLLAVLDPPPRAA